MSWVCFLAKEYPLIFFKSWPTERSKSEVTSLELQVGNNIHNSTYYNNISTPPLLFVVLCVCRMRRLEVLFEFETCSNEILAILTEKLQNVYFLTYWFKKTINIIHPLSWRKLKVISIAETNYSSNSDIFWF